MGTLAMYSFVLGFSIKKIMGKSGIASIFKDRLKLGLRGVICTDAVGGLLLD